MNFFRDSRSKTKTIEDDEPSLRDAEKTLDHEQYPHPAVMNLKLKRTSSDKSGLRKRGQRIKFNLPQKSALKKPSDSQCKRTSRSRSVSFSNLLLEEIDDITEVKEDSDSEYEDCLSDIETKDCESFLSPSFKGLDTSNKESRKSQSLESLNFRPPTPPNASHLVKPINIKNREMLEDSI